MKLKYFGYFLLGLLISCKSATESQVNENPGLPNIVFIMADDLGYGDLGAYGQEIIKTPHIDKLAAEGLRFTQCYSGSSVCAPARSVLMTGLHTGHTRVRGNFGIGGVTGLAGNVGRVPLKKEDVTIAEVLQKAGYHTGMIGKWGLGEPNTSGEPNDQGFDEFFGFLNQRRAHSYYPDYIWRNKEKVTLGGNKEGKGTDYTHDLFANEALHFIERNKDEPFFLYLPLCIPHNDYDVPDLGIYEDRTWGKKQKAYAAMISRMDRSVGYVMDALRKAGIDDNTYVFFTSDNGPANIADEWNIFNSGGPLRGMKRDPYEGGIRVPMIVRKPNSIEAGIATDQPAYFADLFPTFAEIAGVNYSENLDGISILPTIRGDEQPLKDRIMYWEFYEQKGWRIVRFGDWKAIQHEMHRENHAPIELYNISKDIGEMNNLAADYPELIKKAEELFIDSHEPSEHFVWRYLADNIDKTYNQ